VQNPLQSEFGRFIPKFIKFYKIGWDHWVQFCLCHQIFKPCIDDCFFLRKRWMIDWSQSNRSRLKRGASPQQPKCACLPPTLTRSRRVFFLRPSLLLSRPRLLRPSHPPPSLNEQLHPSLPPSSVPSIDSARPPAPINPATAPQRTAHTARCCLLPCVSWCPVGLGGVGREKRGEEAVGDRRGARLWRSCTCRRSRRRI
jgi:hypothetical protein